MSGVAAIRADLAALADAERAAFMARYFKTRPGEYGEGDKFLGIPVPGLRGLARTYRAASIATIRSMLRSKWHEERAVALMIMAARYSKASPGERQELYDLYLSHTAHINNWDLVDCSAEYVVGAHLDAADIALLRKLARSKSLWERRIAILSTRRWIKEGRFEPTLEIATLLLADEHDLIHKACGWMLREVGDRKRAVAEAFLKQHLAVIPRTMLRYAIEKYPEALRQRYLRG